MSLEHSMFKCCLRNALAGFPPFLTETRAAEKREKSRPIPANPDYGPHRGREPAFGALGARKLAFALVTAAAIKCAFVRPRANFRRGTIISGSFV